LFAGGRDFSWQGLAGNSSGTVVAGAIVGDVDRLVVDDDGIRDRAVVDGNVVDVHVIDGAVVVETISVPVAALIADSDIAEAVVDSAVVTDVPPPKTIVVAVSSADVSPIARGP
jgi:hypothetical protein